MIDQKVNKITNNIINKVKLFKALKKSIKYLPDKPGVYFFLKNKNPIYIGKSKNLKARISSYFYTRLSNKTALMVKESQNIGFIEVTSELESLILEAKLVGLLKPKYNIQLKDDKQPLYILITDEKYPRILTGRKSDLGKNEKHHYGPYPKASNIRYVLKILRRIFPFSQHKIGKRGCIYSQIGLCNPCPSEIELTKNTRQKTKLRQEYLKNVRTIKNILDGRFTYVQKKLEKEMVDMAKKEKFEEAAILKKKIDRLNYITQPVTPAKDFIKNPNLIEDIREKELTSLQKFISEFIDLPTVIKRIECYDVAHLSGTKPTASMVTFINGEPDKSLYRHFKIRQKKGSSDTDSMSEVAKRRIKHFSSWGIPDLILVDGGRGQVGTFRKTFEKYKIPVIGLSKREEKLVIPIKRPDLLTKGFVERKLKRGPAKNLVQRLRNEAHRFAQRYHHKLLQKELIPKN